MGSPLLRRHGRRALTVALLIGAAVASMTHDAAAQTYTNPIVPRGADPWVFQWGGQYFYTGTSGSDVKVSRSPWLQSLNSNSRQVWDPPSNTPYGNNLWAPEIHRINGKWYLYVAADDGADANHRMYVLEGDSQDPQGSYTLKGQISIPGNRWAIDGTVFQHGDKNYFIWSGRTSSSGGNDSGSSQSLYIAEMVNPWTLSGNRVAISSPQYAWERRGHAVNEAPQILCNGDDVFLTYSASGFYTPQYAIGALKLTGSNPLLPSAWTKHNQPLFDQGNGVEGTGHASFVLSPDGTEHWMVYHARTNPDAARDVRIQPFTFGSNGLPVFGDPVPTGQPMPTPSGVPLVTFIPNLSFERGGAGWLDDFRAVGTAGAIENDGTRFVHIAGGDGPHIGYLGSSASAIYQDIGPAHLGEYTLSMGLAISSDEQAAAAASPATFTLRIETVGLHPGGSANEADRIVLGETLIDSSLLSVSTFTYFDVAGLVTDEEEVGRWLRVGLYGEGAGFGPGWSVKLDYMTLSHVTLAEASVPEPAATAGLLCLSLFARRRRKPALSC